MRRRPTIRKAVKTAIIVKAARHLGHRAEEHLKSRAEGRLKNLAETHLKKHLTCGRHAGPRQTQRSCCACRGHYDESPWRSASRAMSTRLLTSSLTRMREM